MHEGKLGWAVTEPDGDLPPPPQELQSARSRRSLPVAPQQNLDQAGMVDRLERMKRELASKNVELRRLRTERGEALSQCKRYERQLKLASITANTQGKKLRQQEVELQELHDMHDEALVKLSQVL